MTWLSPSTSLPPPANPISGRSAPVEVRLANGHTDEAVYMSRTGRWLSKSRPVSVSLWRVKGSR